MYTQAGWKFFLLANIPKPRVITWAVKFQIFFFLQISHL